MAPPTSTNSGSSIDNVTDNTIRSENISISQQQELLRGPGCLKRFKGKRTVISFTGGKDCHLALQRSLKAGLEVVGLAIFHPPGKKFQAHRVQWQQVQANAIGIPLVMCPLLSELETSTPRSDEGMSLLPPPDYKAAYAAAIRKLQNDLNIEAIVTGDIDFVGTSRTNFMQQVCQEHDCQGVQVLLPLWKQSRRELLREMLEVYDMDIRMSCVKSPFFNGDWIGRRLDSETMAILETKEGLDLNGENGEYHTMVVNGPMYRKALQFGNVQAEELFSQRGQTDGEKWWVMSEASTKLIECSEKPKA